MRERAETDLCLYWFAWGKESRKEKVEEMRELRNGQLNVAMVSEQETEERQTLVVPDRHRHTGRREDE